jgi:L-fuconolactonase
MRRRQFLTAASSAVLANGIAAYPDLSAREVSQKIVDTHTHFFDPSRPEGIPWPGKGNKELYRPVLPPEFKKIAEPLGIVGTVVVEASPWVGDNQWLLDLAAKDPFLRGIVGSLDTNSDDFAKLLERFARNPLYRGIRISHAVLLKGLDAKLKARCQLLIDHDLELDVNGGPSMPVDVARLAASLPKLRIVINHCANLRIDGGKPPRSWQQAMQAAAKHPNVYCKVSALVEQTGKKRAPREVEYYLPVLDSLWKYFGEDRLIFGSNWPVSKRGAPLSDVVGIVRDYFNAKGDQAANKYFFTNSQAAYKWPER